MQEIILLLRIISKSWRVLKYIFEKIDDDKNNKLFFGCEKLMLSQMEFKKEIWRDKERNKNAETDFFDISKDSVHDKREISCLKVEMFAYWCDEYGNSKGSRVG